MVTWLLIRRVYEREPKELWYGWLKIGWSVRVGQPHPTWRGDVNRAAHITQKRLCHSNSWSCHKTVTILLPTINNCSLSLTNATSLLLKQYTLWNTPFPLAKNSDARNIKKYVSAKPIHNTLPPTPPCLYVLLHFRQHIPHVNGLLTFCWLPIPTCALLIPCLTDLINGLLMGTDSPKNCSW